LGELGGRHSGFELTYKGFVVSKYDKRLKMVREREIYISYLSELTLFPTWFLVGTGF
jgi:hypothetical protein